MPINEDYFNSEFMASLDRLHMIAKRLAPSGLAGQHVSRGLGDSLEFADHRDYSPGDDIRFLDWPYFARMEKLLIRLFHQHSEAPVAIMLDVSASMSAGPGGGKFRYALRAAAALAYVAMGSLRPVVLWPFSDRPLDQMHAGRNRHHILGVLEFLSALEPAGKTQLEHCSQLLAAGNGPKSTIILISDLADCSGELAPSLSQLYRRCKEVLLLQLVAPWDADPSFSGPMLLRHAEMQQRYNVSMTKELLAAYKRGWSQFVEDCRRTCLQRGVNHLAVRTDMPLEKLMLQTLRIAGVVA
jgi:uncharacterized protein (DUF58 family)